jgi:N-acetylglucosamine kinase-like BadF-type ATPase
MTHQPSSTANSNYLLGVDGGGTKTEAWLAEVDDAQGAAIIGRGRAGSSNPRAVGLEAALGNLGAAIDAAWHEARRTPVPARCAVLAISGAGHASMRERIAAWAHARELAADLRFEHDAEAVLAEGAAEGWGVALIVGTGSAAIGADRNRNRCVVGGWGYHFGDEGSAYWIGREALAKVARAADGRAAPTSLTAAILSQLQVDDPRAALGALEKAGNVRGAIAALAQTVEGEAGRGDAAALSIVDEAAEELAAMVDRAAAQLRLGKRFPLALAGGVICGSALLRERLTSALQAKSLDPHPVTLAHHPVAGCVRLALRAIDRPGPLREA